MLYTDAVGQVQPGGRIVFAAGDYDQGILVSKSISLVGRCSSMVTLSGVREGVFVPTILEVQGYVEASVSDLTISGPGFGLFAHSGAQTSISRVSFKMTHTGGIAAYGLGTTVEASEVWVSDTKLDAEGSYGRGIEAGGGATLSVSRSRVSDNHTSGIVAFSDAMVTVSEVWVSGTKLNAAGLSGRGIDAVTGASLSVSRTLISHNDSGGILGSGSGTTLTASEVWVSDTKQVAYGPLSVGIVAHDGASVSVSGSRVSDNHSYGVLSIGSGAALTLSEVWVSGTKLNAEGLDGRGIVAQEGASLSVSGSRVSDNHTLGLAAHDSGTTVEASDVWISGTQLDVDGLYGFGITLNGGASVSLSGSKVSDNHSSGIAAFDSGTTVAASEVWVSGTKLNAEGVSGFGVVAQDGAIFSLSGSRLSDNHLSGVFAIGEGTMVTTSEVWVSDTRPDADGFFGFGMEAASDAILSVSGSYLSDNHTVAVAFFESGGSVTESLLESTKFGGNLLGDGLMATGSVVTVTGVISRDNARAGVLFDKSDGELSKSLITQNAIGLANQGLPGAEISDDNVIEGNDQDRIDDGDLEVPDEAMSLPSLPGSG
ncbi:MAG: hypothetical protein CL940_07730 [Deltaproteobacteria bacterium]|nr:hypothetical protein [Deltaproteobacteria bacterium]